MPGPLSSISSTIQPWRIDTRQHDPPRPSRLLYGVAAILDEVEDDLLELAGMSLDIGQIRG